MNIMNRLTKLANKWQTDKGTEFEDSHGYTEFYQQFFEKYEHPKIVEVGTWRGSSIRMLNEFFDGDCEIWACDWNAELLYLLSDVPNVHLMLVDVNEMETIDILRAELEKSGGIDIIIDDASHEPQAQMNLLSGLHSVLNEDGIYIIEDIHFNRLRDNKANSPLYFLNFLEPSNLLSDGENVELISKIKDVQIFSRKNHAFEMDTKYGGRSMTSVITFEKS